MKEQGRTLSVADFRKDLKSEISLSSCLPFSAVAGLSSITGFQIVPKPSLLGGKKKPQNRKDLFQERLLYH